MTKLSGWFCLAFNSSCITWNSTEILLTKKLLLQNIESQACVQMTTSIDGQSVVLIRLNKPKLKWIKTEPNLIMYVYAPTSNVLICKQISLLDFSLCTRFVFCLRFYHQTSQHTNICYKVLDSKMLMLRNSQSQLHFHVFAESYFKGQM